MIAVVFLVKCGSESCLVISSLLQPRQLQLYVESPCGPLSSMAATDELGGKTQASLFFWAKSSVSAYSYTVWRSNFSFSSNLCRITGDVNTQIKASLSASSLTCFAVLSPKLQSRRNLSRLWKKSSIDSSCLCFLVAKVARKYSVRFLRILIPAGLVLILYLHRSR